MSFCPRLLQIIAFCFLVIPFDSAYGQVSNDIDNSLIGQASFSESNELTISWLAKNSATAYEVLKRSDSSTPWQLVAEVQEPTYTFSELFTEPVEVRVRALGNSTATMNIWAGNEYFKNDEAENMLIIVTESLHQELSSLIAEYREVLDLELISSDLYIVDENTPVPSIKSEIVSRNSTKEIDYIFILGHVAVPYAGNFAIDGHNDHEGAWVADGYYGELNGNWTDNIVSNTTGNREATHNVPGDGKFDNTFFPSDVEIPVGRVDFSDLPILNESEVVLTRRYLRRNINYRMGQFKATRRAIIDNNLNLAEGFGQGAIKSFHTMFEPDSISYGLFANSTEKDYLFTFGSGGGSYQSASGIIRTSDLVTDSLQTIFMTIFGSYHGDWDIQNNLMRVALARGTALTNAWSGRPIWYFHSMAMGETVGSVLLNTQNNNNWYNSDFGNGGCHTSLLGDPSLKLLYHEPVENIAFGNEEVTWEYLSNDPEVNAYTVYYEDANQEWQLLGQGPRSERSFSLNEIPLTGSTRALIRPVGFIESRSGSYYNEGIGSIVNLTISSNRNVHTSNKHIYPNPAKTYLNVSELSWEEDIFIYDAVGKLVAQSINEQIINIERLPTGMYVLRSKEGILRFVKQ